MTRKEIKVICADPKKFLLKGQKSKELIAAKRERIDDWRRLADSITVTLTNDGGSGGGYKQSIVENAVCNIVDLENEIISEINNLVTIERNIREVIGFVTDNRFKAILEMRYLNGYSWHIIADRLYYGVDWVCRLHGAALEEIKRYYEISR